MVDNIVTASVSPAGRVKTRPLYQYDYGQILKITGIDLPAAYEVHFANSEYGASTTQIGNADGVAIPDAYLLSGADVFAWLYFHSGTDDGETVYKILIPVCKRAAITPEQPTPVQQDTITQAIAALDAAVAQTAQDVEDAEAASETAQSAAASAHLSDLSAQQSATEAADSASQAASSAQTATTKATEAATSATAAQTAQGAAAASAQTAQTAATSASAKADEAAASAATASGKAADAANSANAAQSAANSAAAAQSAAETAQSAAETAADEAESSAEDAQEAKEAAETLMITPATGGESAAVATVTDAANDQPMALKIGIEPVQDLHGYDNPWPAGGGKNKFTTTGEASGKYLNEGGDIVSGSGWMLSDYIPVSPSTQYTFNPNSTEGYAAKSWYFDANKLGISAINSGQNTFSTPDNCYFMRFSYRETSANIQLELGSTATAYAPYSNICPISGWTGANITVAGENQNIWDEEWENGTFNVTTGADITVSSQIRSRNLIPIRGGVSYYFKTGGVAAWCILYNDDGTVMQTPSISGTRDTAGNSFTIKDEAVTLPDGTAYMRFYMISAYGATYKNDISINYPATDTAYHAEHVKTYEVSFPAAAGTVYGGSLKIAQDGSGTLTVDTTYIELNGDYSWGGAGNTGYDGEVGTNRYIEFASNNLPVPLLVDSGLGQNGKAIRACDRLRVQLGPIWANDTNNDVINFNAQSQVHLRLANATIGVGSTADGATRTAAFKAWLTANPVHVAYQIAAPQTYIMTAEQIKSLFGTNNIWADCGSTQITAYYADKTLLIMAAERRIENLTVSSETLPAGSPASVEKQESADGINLHFGIPKGADGTGGGVTDVQVNGTSVVQDGVANVPIAGGTRYGVVRVGGNYGLKLWSANDSLIVLAAAVSSQIKAGDWAYQPIVTSRQHESVYYGLAKAAGADMNNITGETVGVYPEAQKSAISDMLNSPVTVSGTTPTITALSGIQYVCGEVSTLDITLPDSGIVDVVFESGSTPTVLTINPPAGVTEVNWADGWDEVCEANTTYELNIMNGKLGVKGAWT